jgi:hypothetical protein
MRLSLGLALSLLAAPAVAQDPAAQFADATRAFILPGTPSLGLTDLLSDTAVIATLPSLEGTWGPAYMLFPEPDSFEAERFAQACERTGMELEQTARRSFVITKIQERDGVSYPLHVRHAWISGNAFDRSVDEAELIAHYDLEAPGEPPMRVMSGRNLRGEVAMFHPSPDILVFVAPGELTEILVRCP